MSDCIFCDILAGRRPASVVHEDDRALVLLDLFPVTEGHALIIPRHHAQFVEELPPELLAHVNHLAQRLIRAQKQVAARTGSLVVNGHNLVINDGPAANQHVPHVHLHVIPRKGGDTFKVSMTWATRLVNVFGLARRRHRLDRLAALLREHFPAE